jgi:hypothetical protein
MEAIREGVEDYEYLARLRDGIANAEKKGGPNQALDRARKLLNEVADRVCNAQGTDALRWTDEKDRNVADRVRVEILDALTELSARESRKF